MERISHFGKYDCADASSHPKHVPAGVGLGVVAWKLDEARSSIAHAVDTTRGESTEKSPVELRMTLETTAGPVIIRITAPEAGSVHWVPCDASGKEMREFGGGCTAQPHKPLHAHVRIPWWLHQEEVWVKIRFFPEYGRLETRSDTLMKISDSYTTGNPIVDEWCAKVKESWQKAGSPDMRR